jgi:hypothetical protein
MVPTLQFAPYFPLKISVHRNAGRGINLDLVDGWHYFVRHNQVHNSVGVEVAHTDGFNLAFFMQFVQCTPRTMDITEWLVKQIQVKVVKL